MTRSKTYYLLSLGCPKNEVDAECMSYILQDSGYQFVAEPQSADFLIINTCGFIDAAKMEAIEATLDLAELKGPNSKLVLTGCLPQRFMREIYTDLPEVDACIGTAEYEQIAEVLDALAEGRFERRSRPLPPGSLAHLSRGRKISRDRFFAYQKVAEGCSNNCAFCAIPGIRGPLRSRDLAELLDEAKQISDEGFRELILVAQDTARYGTDLKQKSSLAELLKLYLRETELAWIRTMYTYGDAITPELIELMASEERLVPYLDMPIQHASDNVLARMRRKERKADIIRTMESLRSKIPQLSLRSTILIGFPGETEDDIKELLEFIEEHPFDRLGCFQFSAEEKTPAYRMSDPVPPELAAERVARVMELQAKIARERARARISSKTRLLVEGIAEDGIFYQARSTAEAPEIDPVIYLLNESGVDLELGDFVEAEIIDINGYDLTAKTV
ncbi:MAG: 30S ribosomal protein S12 methylthiotransferase RimO [Eubacteriales bacterium]|nr:30S ribosomal protein S12 methylthiotransferase RimO [Eubacteriales bacterium]